MGNSASVHDRCREGDVTGLKELLQASSETADVEKVDEYGRTALLVAAGSDPVVKAPSPTPQQQQDGMSERSESEAFPSIGSDTDPSTGHSLSIAAQKKQLVVDMINLLVEKQANLDHRDEKGWTALHYACQAQNDAAVECLLKHGALPTRDSLGLLPQDLLLHSGYPDSIKVAEDVAGILHRVTEPNEYKLKLLSLRSSGIAEIRLGSHIEKGSIVTVEIDVPENHSPKDYIQLLIYNEAGDTNLELGPVQPVPAGATGTPDDIDWVDILPENHIVAVNDVVIAGMSFENSIRQLQVNNGHKCTKLLMQNSVALGDFIHEKILGLGVIGNAANPYVHLVKQLDALRVSKQKEAEVMHDHRTIHALGEDMSWLKKRKLKPYLKVKHKATHLKVPIIDKNNDGTLNFDEFVDLLSQNDAKHGIHPLEKLVQMAQHGVMGDAALSLQTLIPSYQRKLMLESLMAYGCTTYSPRNRHELEMRQANEAMLQRADIALHVLDNGGATIAVSQDGGVGSANTVNAKKDSPQPTARILQAGSTLRRRLAAKESSPALFNGKSGDSSVILATTIMRIESIEKAKDESSRVDIGLQRDDDVGGNT
ncbi:hypothetical protein DYB32_003857 [Aphanomyces invadans]|uniref:EF-hand domain-containing protein n=1 Tax=Aphanomyces invadans TaxID=157072 RepID=A0A418AZH2_9STRA|nr:hypothetical protein DYB32_003857 [Aphanomyces invadans]